MHVPWELPHLSGEIHPRNAADVLPAAVLAANSAYYSIVKVCYLVGQGAELEPRMKVFSLLTLLCATSVNAGYLCACKYKVPEVIHTQITQRVCARIPNARLDGSSCNIGNNKDLIAQFNKNKEYLNDHTIRLVPYPEPWNKRLFDFRCDLKEPSIWTPTRPFPPPRPRIKIIIIRIPNIIDVSHNLKDN
ncbi:hypothetical protein LZ32DRAFT_621820 [Colletotrichum eremochloae]|nr:hypothetical protein LZ32DRAFT_621820 [Colletotrichum eremochloae]